MKYSIAALAILAAPFASAGSLTELPTCAQSAAEAGISATGCAESDFACICGDSKFVTSLHSLIETVCSAADQQVTLAFAQQICDAVGVTLSIPTPSVTASSIIPATTAASVPSAIETAAVTSSASSSYSTLPTPSAPYAFANGSASINGTNSTIPFTGDAAERKAMGLQLAGSALSIAVLMGFFL
ncbi:hypothetical protein HO173_002197 [Letharia columbiana]|uniref:CFEM domain-containing protein n=1 Tax=Letharia columbiana TaxID=112416 RepID=A0A8H6G357_9LECA|nr:uncharacterized protein HO173_002197 [Letharia columbiana]KAF6239651.1 hypothetical protein HO173_002197 [Letharia columbiana]